MVKEEIDIEFVRNVVLMGLEQLNFYVAKNGHNIAIDSDIAAYHFLLESDENLKAYYLIRSNYEQPRPSITEAAITIGWKPNGFTTPT